MTGKDVTAYVDGSFNNSANRYGSGIVLICDSEMKVLYRGGDDPQLVGMRNVAGELNAAILAISMAPKEFPDISSLTICHDYEGISKWVTGEWKAKKGITQGYRDFVKAQTFPVKFIKVDAHSGDYYNNTADKLAKMGAGLEV